VVFLIGIINDIINEKIRGDIVENNLGCSFVDNNVSIWNE